MRTDRKSLELLIENLAGLSIGDTERLARKAIFDDGALLPSDLPAVMQAKYELLNRGGVLAFEYDTAQFADVGGCAPEGLAASSAQPAFDGAAPQLDAPKGVLLLGVQGCGKSLAAKAVAGIFGVPLLRLDFGALYNKFIGETERNLREALATADAMAPCVLWIDEIEKGVATGDGDSGASRRLLGTLLTWMAETQDEGVPRRDRERHRGAAAGAAAQGPLRRDLLRRPAGRRPCAARSCASTWQARLQLSRRRAAALAALCDGFSGAEIEQAVVSALYAAHAAGRTVGAPDILREIKAHAAAVGGDGGEGRRAAGLGGERTVPADWTAQAELDDRMP